VILPVAVGALLAVAILVVVLLGRRTRIVAKSLPHEGLSEQDVASLQRKQRAAARTVHVRGR
jgi:hypothetical protein